MSHFVEYSVPFDIDAVITWVDGQDVLHQAKRRQYAATHGISAKQMPPATRYNACGELAYCVRSLLYFAPWLRTIYVVTDAQQPPLPLHPKIKCLDHRDIFYDVLHCLPTFNSLTIETVLWRIPGLADYFIYCNDDVFLLRPVVPADFFQLGRVVLRGAWKKVTHARWFKAWREPDEHRIVQENAARYVGFRSHYWRLPHVPHPVYKPVLADFFAEHRALMLHNIQYAVRDVRQYSPVGLLTHLCIKQQRVSLDNHRHWLMIHAGQHSDQVVKRRLSAAEADARVAFACFQSMDEADVSRQQALFAWLDQRIPSWCESA